MHFCCSLWLFFIFEAQIKLCLVLQIKNILKDKFPQITCQIHVKCHSMYIKITLESHIFILKALGYVRHFSRFSGNKPNATKSYGRSHYPRSCSNLWRQLRTNNKALLYEIHTSDLLQKQSVSCSRLTSQIWTRTRVMAAPIALCGIRFSARKLRKVAGISQCFPNENLLF